MRILWVKGDFLHPTTRGGRIRTLEILKRLHARHEVHYIAFEQADQQGSAQLASEYCTRAYPVPLHHPSRASLAFAVQALRNLFSSMPLSIARYCTKEMREQIASVLQSVHFDSVVCDFIAPAPNFEDLGQCVVFEHNVETMIWRRHAQTAGDPVRQWYFGSQAERMFDWERRICQAAAHVIAVSPQDAALMRDMFGIEASCIPTGVDVEYFRRPDTEISRSADMVFVGSMDWMPNIDGMEWFVREILPLIWQKKPDATVAIVGRSPSKAMLALGESDRRIRVTGTVPDVRPWLWGARISIVPLRIGGGTRLKVYEAMAAATPVVSTAVGAEGLDVTHQENIMFADAPAEFASRCIELLDDAHARQSLSSHALYLVSSRFSSDTIADEFEKLLIAAQRNTPAAELAAKVSSH